jgi:hypothetical protein
MEFFSVWQHANIWSRYSFKYLFEKSIHSFTRQRVIIIYKLQITKVLVLTYTWISAVNIIILFLSRSVNLTLYVNLMPIYQYIGFQISKLWLTTWIYINCLHQINFETIYTFDNKIILFLNIVIFFVLGKSFVLSKFVV